MAETFQEMVVHHPDSQDIRQLVAQTPLPPALQQIVRIHAGFDQDFFDSKVLDSVFASIGHSGVAIAKAKS